MSSARYAARDGIKAYSWLGLRLYDPLIVGVLAPLAWQCPPEAFIASYRKHLRANHADIGVGTGCWLDQCGFDVPDPRLALIDLQPNCLAFTARRLARYRPETYLRDARQPLVGIPAFDSVSLGGLLHCLPGDMHEKAAVFDALRPICKPGATVFGQTLVNDAIGATTRRRLAWHALNDLRVVNCRADTADGLHHELAARFSDCIVETIGCFAFFSARAH